MDPDLVRLVLIVLGVLLVVGIYLWDRFKRSVPRSRPQRRRRSPAAFDGAETDAAVSTPDAAVEAVERREQPHSQPPEAQPVDVDRPTPPQPAPEGPDASATDDWSDLTNAAEPQFSMDLSFSADADHGGRGEAAMPDDIEHLIVVIHVIGRDRPISGPVLEKACAELGLQGGDMSIYHRRGPDGGVMFSMASMVEPGIFPFDDMAAFETPGLSLFTQLPGVRDGIETYEAMLQTAQRLATALKAELQDDRHNKLTRQMQEHTRESIIEHRRRVRLARSRH